MPNEAVAIIYCCEQRLGHPIPEEDLHRRALGQYLRPEDYQPIQKVSNVLFTFLLVDPPSCLGTLQETPKTHPSPLSVKGQLTNFCKS